MVKQGYMMCIIKKALDANFIEFEKDCTENKIDLQKVDLEYIIDNANDIIKFASKLLERLEKSDN